MRHADLAVVPKRASSSFGNEAMSTKIMEFMALGVPVIVSRTTVDSHYHDDSRVKFFESENVADLAKAILLVRSDRRLRETMVSHASQYVLLNNWNEKKRIYFQLLDHLCPRKSAFPEPLGRVAS